MKLNVGCDITVRADARCPIVAMLRPRSGLAQWLSSETYVFDPWVPTTENVDSYGNLCQRMVVPAGDMRIRVEAVVETEDTLAVTPAASQSAVDRLPHDVLQFLLPSRYCPSDTLESRALEVPGAAAPGYPQVEAIRAWIQQHIEYRHGASDASTDGGRAVLAYGRDAADVAFISNY